MIVEDLGYEKNHIVLDLRINAKNKRQRGNLRGNKQYYLRHTFHKKFVSKIFHHLSSKKIRTFIFHLLKTIGSFFIADKVIELTTQGIKKLDYWIKDNHQKDKIFY